MAGARISREKAWVRWLGRVFLEKKLRSDGWGRVFQEKKLRSDGWGRVFLEKKLGLDGWGAYFSRKKLDWMIGTRISREKSWTAWLERVFNK